MRRVCETQTISVRYSPFCPRDEVFVAVASGANFTNNSNPEMQSCIALSSLCRRYKRRNAGLLVVGMRII